MNKIYRFIENSSKMTFPEKNNNDNYNNIIFICMIQSYIS